MTKFLARRIAAMVGVLVVLVGVMFGLEHFTPADPVAASLGRGASPAIVAALRRRLGYDRPLAVQFASYVGNVVRGNLGTSLHTHNPVSTDLANTLPATIELVVTAFALALVGALILGLVSSSRRRGARIVRIGLLGGASAPVFLVSLVLIIVF
jgi:peptide/nickel transport system permease protein